MNIINLTPPALNTRGLIETLDDVRKAVDAGEVVALALVTIAPDDVTCAYVASTGTVSRLRVIGAVTSLQHGFIEGKV